MLLFGAAILAVLVLLLSDRLLGRSLRAHPSSRAAGFSMVALVCAAEIVTIVLLHARHPVAAGVVAVLGALAAVVCLVWQVAMLRRDIRAGRAGVV